MGNGKLFIIPSELSKGTSLATTTPQTIAAIRSCSYFLAENIRTARRFISSLQADIVIESLHFEVLDKRTQRHDLRDLLKPLFSGNNVGIISEAGCPGIADPGALAVEIAHQNNLTVVPLVGPSSILLALMASGFNGQSFVFHGYLPIDKKDRAEKIRKIEKESSRLKQTQLFMDTPYRNPALFSDLLKHCHPQTMLSIARDITGEQEMIRTLNIGQWKKEKVELKKIPVIFSLYTM
ncbi:MAG: SAM-dependent methyltransferase [Bacteroidota bacterium]